MATAAPAFEDRTLSIGRVFERAFAAIRTNPVVIIGLALLVGAVPGLIITFLFVQLGLGTSATAIQNGAISSAGIFTTVLLSSLIGVAVNAVVQGAMTKATVLASEGKKASFLESLSAGLRVALPLIGLAIVMGLGIMIGMILLIVPGVILFLMWTVAAPALVVERGGIGAALRRSADLTKGARWKILALFIILAVAEWLLSKVFGLVGLSQYSLASPAGLAASVVIGSVLLGTIYNTISGALWPSLYVELRQWKEGTSAQRLEEIFA